MSDISHASSSSGDTGNVDTEADYSSPAERESVRQPNPRRGSISGTLLSEALRYYWEVSEGK